MFYGTEHVLLPLKWCCYICIIYGGHVFYGGDTFNYIISAAILDFLLPVSFGSVTDSTIEKLDPENMYSRWNCVYSYSLEAEIPLGVVYPLPLQHKRH